MARGVGVGRAHLTQDMDGWHRSPPMVGRSERSILNKLSFIYGGALGPRGQSVTEGPNSLGGGVFTHPSSHRVTPGIAIGVGEACSHEPAFLNVLFPFFGTMTDTCKTPLYRTC